MEQSQNLILPDNISSDYNDRIREIEDTFNDPRTEKQVKKTVKEAVNGASELVFSFTELGEFQQKLKMKQMEEELMKSSRLGRYTKLGMASFFAIVVFFAFKKIIPLIHWNIF